MKQLFFLSLFLLSIANFEKQNVNLLYPNTQKSVENYTARAFVSRMLDGLGFRYYWATEGLSAKDLSYQLSQDSRTTEESLDHILDLSQTIVNSVLGIPSGTPQPKMSFEEKRNKTFKNMEQANQIFGTAEDLSKFTIVLKRGDKTYEFPFWNQLNDPISDALWHVGAGCFVQTIVWKYICKRSKCFYRNKELKSYD